MLKVTKWVGNPSTNAHGVINKREHEVGTIQHFCNTYGFFRVQILFKMSIFSSNNEQNNENNANAVSFHCFVHRLEKILTFKIKF
jgi:hypothetical protein